MDNIITITNENGKEIKCEILFTYHSDDFNHDYVVFKETNTLNVSAAIYNENGDGTGSLDQIDNEEEWALIEDLLEEWQEKNEICQNDCKSCGDKNECKYK